MTELHVIGKALPRVDASEKVTGEAEYIADLRIRNMLYGKILGSPYPHARILNKDLPITPEKIVKALKEKASK